MGCRQVFLRFFNCNLNCFYCDTRMEEAPAFCRIEKGLGTGEFYYRQNPLKVSDLISILHSFSLHIHHSLSLTGGEPLLQVNFLKEFLPALKKETAIKIFLETNGTLVVELEEILPLLDILAIDFKLPSSLEGKSYLETHHSFLQKSLEKICFVKIIITPLTQEEELKEYLLAIKDVSPSVPVILQPVTPVSDRDKDSDSVRDSDKESDRSSNGGSNRGTAVSPGRIFDLQGMALEILPEVRVIPQVHKMLGYL